MLVEVREPWDEHELEIIRQMEVIKAEYMERIEPLQKMLVYSQSLKTPRYFVMPDEPTPPTN